MSRTATGPRQMPPRGRARNASCVSSPRAERRWLCLLRECANTQRPVSTGTRSDHALFGEMLGRYAPAVHLVLQAAHGRAAQVPCEPGAGGAAANDLVSEERVKIVHRVDLGRRGVAPAAAEEAEPPLHLAQHEDGLLAHRLGAGLAMADRALVVEGTALAGFTAAGDDEGRRRPLRRHREAEGVEAWLGRLSQLGTDIAAGDGVGGAVVDAPPGERPDVVLVEGAEAVVGEGQGRAQLARAEGGDRSLARRNQGLDALEA